MTLSVKKLFLYLCVAGICLAPTWASAEGSPGLLGNDFVRAGDKITITSYGIDDVFAMGRNIEIVTAITGSAHLLASDVSIEASIGTSIYAAADQIDIKANIGGDALLLAKSIAIDSAIGGDLRGAATMINIAAAIAGDVQFGSQNINLNGPVGGTAVFATDNLAFGPNARIDGDLILYGAASKDFEIPARVISPDRVIYRTSSQIVEQEFVEPVGEHMGTIGRGIFYQLLVAIILTSSIVIIARNFTSNAYGRAWKSVLGSMGYGFLGLSLLSGSVLVTALTFIGIPLSILLIAATVIVAMLGYWMGSYFIGARIWFAARAELPSSVISILLAVTVGVICTALMSAIPILGWWLAMAITLFGVGAISPWRSRRVGA